MTNKNKILKRTLDFVISLLAVLLLSGPIIVLIILSSISTKSFGLFYQNRIGYLGKKFTIYKIKTMLDTSKPVSHVTQKGNKRITKLGNWLRKYKLDELPQLFNVLIGNMSLVGPRPDAKGFADELIGEDKIILSVKPGITGPASLFFKNEEELLAKQKSPEEYNREVIWPQKININKEYIKNYTFKEDLKILYRTFING